MKINKNQITLFFCFSLLALLNSISAFSIEKAKAIEQTDKIIEEGKMLYNTEITSWNGTEAFLASYNGDKSKVGGYFSYYSKDKNQFLNVYYNNDKKSPKIIFTTRFSNESNSNDADKNAVNTSNIKKENVEREMTDYEKQLFIMRQKTLDLFPTDTIFKHYDQTNLNIIPMVYEGTKKVYVITIAKIDGVVVMGNDYELIFDANNNITSKKKLHSDILPVDIGNDKNRGITYHTHIKSSGELITVTDVAILLLSAKGAGWLQHYTLSGEWVTMWDVTNEKFTIKSKVEFDRENGR